jgi:methionine-rich copper-binding protein CopC
LWRLIAITAAAIATAVIQLPAFAHSTLLSTTPADQATVVQTPAVVVLTFDEPAVALGTRITVTGPNGPAQTGPPQLVDNNVSQPLQPGSPAGSYTVDWRVTSADGHPQTGQFHFVSTKAESGSAVPPSTPTAAEGSPTQPSSTSGAALWGAAILLVALTAGAILLVIRHRERQPNPTPDSASEPKDTP